MQQKDSSSIDGVNEKEKFRGKPFREIVKFHVRTLSVGQIANQMADILDGLEGTSRKVAEWASAGFATLAEEKSFWKRDWVEVAQEIRSTSSAYFKRLGEVPSEETLLNIVQVVVLTFAYTQKSDKTRDKHTIVVSTPYHG